MKKILLTFLVLCLILPLKVLAVSDVDFDITKYTIDANIQDNGDVNVCEYIKLYGSYNGYIRDIYYKDNQGSDHFHSRRFLDCFSLLFPDLRDHYHRHSV